MNPAILVMIVAVAILWILGRAMITDSRRHRKGDYPSLDGEKKHKLLTKQLEDALDNNGHPKGKKRR